MPMQPDAVEVKRDSHGMIHLRLSAEPSGLHRYLVRWLRFDPSRKIELDEYGTAYYAHVDGHTSLRRIVEMMTEQFGRSREDTEQAVMLFTKKLMQMQMIQLKVPAGQLKDAAK
jgi:hypothetical protein